MLLDPVSNPGPLTYESGALPIALRGPAIFFLRKTMKKYLYMSTAAVVIGALRVKSKQGLI